MKNVLVAVAFAAASCGSQAALIEVTGGVNFGCTGGSGAFEPVCSSTSGLGTFRFVYDSAVVDSDPASTTGLFVGALRSLNITIQQDTRADLRFVLSGSGDVLTALSIDSLLLRGQAVELGGAYGLSSFGLGFQKANGFDPNVLPDLSFWTVRPSDGPYGFLGNIAGVIRNDWGSVDSARILPTAIPNPATLPLLLAGLGGIAFLRRGRAK